MNKLFGVTIVALLSIVSVSVILDEETSTAIPYFVPDPNVDVQVVPDCVEYNVDGDVLTITDGDITGWVEEGVGMYRFEMFYPCSKIVISGNVILAPYTFANDPFPFYEIVEYSGSIPSHCFHNVRWENITSSGFNSIQSIGEYAFAYDDEYSYMVGEDSFFLPAILNSDMVIGEYAFKITKAAGDYNEDFLISSFRDLNSYRNTITVSTTAFDGHPKCHKVTFNSTDPTFEYPFYFLPSAEVESSYYIDPSSGICTSYNLNGQDYADLDALSVAIYSIKDSFHVTVTPNISKNYKISYNVNGGSVNIAEAIFNKELTPSYILPDYTGTKDGFSFSGWKIGDSLYDSRASIVPESDITVTAVWKATAPPPIISYTYNITNLPVEIVLISGSTITLHLTVDAPAGYTLTYAGESWLTVTDGSLQGTAPVVSETTTYQNIGIYVFENGEYKSSKFCKLTVIPELTFTSAPTTGVIAYAI